MLKWAYPPLTLCRQNVYILFPHALFYTCIKQRIKIVDLWNKKKIKLEPYSIKGIIINHNQTQSNRSQEHHLGGGRGHFISEILQYCFKHAIQPRDRYMMP